MKTIWEKEYDEDITLGELEQGEFFCDVDSYGDTTGVQVILNKNTYMYLYNSEKVTITKERKAIAVTRLKIKSIEVEKVK